MTHASRCPDEATWRLFVDPDGARDPALADYLAGCAVCQASVVALTTAYRMTAEALLIPTPPVVDLDAAWIRLQAAAAVTPAVVLPFSPKEAAVSRFFNRSRVLIGGVAAAAAVLAVVAFTPGGQTAFADFIAQFRSQRFVAVPVDTNAITGGVVPALPDLGTVTGALGKNNSVVVATIAEAERLTGLKLKQPEAAALPSGLRLQPTILVSKAAETRLTFDKAKARAYFDRIGRADLALPDKLNGVTFIVGSPDAVILQYASGNQAPIDPQRNGGEMRWPTNGASVVILGQSRPLTAGVEGTASFEEVRDFLLTLPGISDSLRRQLQGVADPRNTLPIPVPAGQVSSQEVTINGAPALVLTDRQTNQGSGAIWQKDGQVYGVAGPLTVDQLRRIGDSLK